MLRPIIFVNRRSELADHNVGDQLCSPLLYFGGFYPRGYRAEILLRNRGRRDRLKYAVLSRIRDAAEAVVIGGGGLLGNSYFRNGLKFWTEGPAPKILWGAGHNSHDGPTAVADWVPDECDYEQLKSFAAVGLRDWVHGFGWVPCSSCMHPLLREPQGSAYDVVFAMHLELRQNREIMNLILRRAPNSYDVVFNDEPPEIFLGKLRRARLVVTNSYHAAYWATLLKKAVVVIGGGTKVRLFKHAVLTGSPSDWPEVARQATIYPTALEECCDANSDFNASVIRKFIRGSRIPRARSVV
jgi:hypothetical protein